MFSLTHHATDFPHHEVVATATPDGRFTVTVDGVTFRVVCADAFRDGAWLVLAIRQTRKGTDYVRTVGATTRTMSWLVEGSGPDASTPDAIRTLVADLDDFLSANTPAVAPVVDELDDVLDLAEVLDLVRPSAGFAALVADEPSTVDPSDEVDAMFAPLTLAGRPARRPECLLPAVTPVATCAPPVVVDEPAPDGFVWMPGTADRIGIMIPGVMALVLVVLVALGFGAPDSRAALGLPVALAPEVSTSATFADRDATRDEDSPRWDCLTDGNRLCGPFHGPTT